MKNHFIPVCVLFAWGWAVNEIFEGNVGKRFLCISTYCVLVAGEYNGGWLWGEGGGTGDQLGDLKRGR